VEKNFIFFYAWKFERLKAYLLVFYQGLDDKLGFGCQLGVSVLRTILPIGAFVAAKRRLAQLLA
jgi:hypothetical protein